MSDPRLADMRARYPIARAWHDLGLPGEPGKNCRSPFPEGHAHGDASPSFSVFGDGRRWKDFATGEGGDVLDLVAKTRNCAVKEAIRFVEERLGLARPAERSTPLSKIERLSAQLRRGTVQEHRELAQRRGFSVAGLKLAEDRGLLRFCELWGQPAWCVTDSRRALVESRRLDGAKWPAYGRLGERKSHAYGSKSWPLGVLESVPFPKIALVEGAPDLLGACHFIVAESKEWAVAPVAVLGASNHHLDPAALVYFKGKRICIYPHLDDAGRTATRCWARALQGAGAGRVTAFDLSGLMLLDGSAGKDLADVCRISADCWEDERKFQEVMP